MTPAMQYIETLCFILIYTEQPKNNIFAILFICLFDMFRSFNNN